jgi:SEC-C motif-containing protein
MSDPKPCYCGNDKSFSECCDLFISKGRQPMNPATLMRSRYSAFCIKDMSHIVKTTHPKSRQGFNREAHQEWADTSEFFKLEIIKASQVGDSGLVEFKAHSKKKGDAKDEIDVHHEVSSFRRDKGTWFFLNGKVIEDSHAPVA